MKRFIIALFLLMGVGSVATPPMAYADWTYGTARFKGDKPRNCLSHGVVIIYYNGTLRQTGVGGNTEFWECTGDVCVIIPKNYKGRKMEFKTGGSCQIQYV